MTAMAATAIAALALLVGAVPSARATLPGPGTLVRSQRLDWIGLAFA